MDKFEKFARHHIEEAIKGDEEYIVHIQKLRAQKEKLLKKPKLVVGYEVLLFTKHGEGKYVWGSSKKDFQTAYKIAVRKYNQTIGSKRPRGFHAYIVVGEERIELGVDEDSISNG